MDAPRCYAATYTLFCENMCGQLRIERRRHSVASPQRRPEQIMNTFRRPPSGGKGAASSQLQTQANAATVASLSSRHQQPLLSSRLQQDASLCARSSRADRGAGFHQQSANSRSSFVPLNVFAPAQVRLCVRVMLAAQPTPAASIASVTINRSCRRRSTAPPRQTAPWTFQPAPSSCPTSRRSASRPSRRRWSRTCSR